MSKETKINKILLPIDGSEASFKTAKYATALANQLGASVIILHVITVPDFPRYLKSIDVYYEEAKKEVESWFDMIADFWQSKNLKIKTKIATGAFSVVESIVEVADKENVDIIIIGSRGRSQFKKLLLGSVTNGVVTHAKCPVLVVK